VFAGDELVDVAAGQIGSQALELALIDQVVVNQVPVVFGSGPSFATGSPAEPLRLGEPDRDRWAQPHRARRPGHAAVYDVSRLRPTVVSIPTRSMRGASAAIT
jgi:hypothetical protein